MHGIFAIYKPKGPTSFRMIAHLRRITGEKTVGHAGTLDPLASGVLVVGVGREATRRLAQEVAKEKEYVATIKLGEVSTTDDAEGVISKFRISNFKFQNFLQNIFKNSARPVAKKIKAVLDKFIGEIQQVPPAFSAIKVNGKRSYKLARQGKSPEMQPRPVVIKEIEIIEYAWPILKIRVVCGSGTYIRSLARDIGEELSIGGYLADLIRTRVGEYTVEKCEEINFIWNLSKQ